MCHLLLKYDREAKPLPLQWTLDLLYLVALILENTDANLVLP